MTLKEIVEFVASIATSLEIPYAYDHFSSPTNPPFLAFLIERDDFIADDTNYQKIVRLIIEFYSDNKEPEMEETIESLLLTPYTVESTYLDTEKLYMTTYEMEVCLSGEQD